MAVWGEGAEFICQGSVSLLTALTFVLHLFYLLCTSCGRGIYTYQGSVSLLNICSTYCLLIVWARNLYTREVFIA